MAPPVDVVPPSPPLPELPACPELPDAPPVPADPQLVEQSDAHRSHPHESKPVKAPSSAQLLALESARQEKHTSSPEHVVSCVLQALFKHFLHAALRLVLAAPDAPALPDAPAVAPPNPPSFALPALGPAGPGRAAGICISTAALARALASRTSAARPAGDAAASRVSARSCDAGGSRAARAARRLSRVTGASAHQSTAVRAARCPRVSGRRASRRGDGTSVSTLGAVAARTFLRDAQVGIAGPTTADQDRASEG